MQVYRANGCAACHTEQVRQSGIACDVVLTSPGKDPASVSNLVATLKLNGLAKEVAAEGIRVNAISPGLIDTEIHAEAGIGDRLQKVIPMVPMGRLGSAEECAEAILWLMSGEAAYMIGSILTLSGGR